MLRHAVILLHGLIVPSHYYEDYTGIPAYFKKKGVDFYVYRRPRDLAIDQRFTHFKAWMDKWPKDKKYHLLGHSAGGIDGRYYLHMTKDPRCVSLVTIGTPHLGTPLANAVLEPTCTINKKIFTLLFDQFQNAKQAVWEMTPEHMAGFNEFVTNVPGIYYGAMLFDIDWYMASPMSWSTNRYLKEKGFEANDGTVPVSSQMWGDYGTEVYMGDHKSQLAEFKYGGVKIWKTTVDNYIQKVRMVEHVISGVSKY